MHCQEELSGFNLATPDARHRRPLKFIFYHQSVKTQRTVPRAYSQLGFVLHWLSGWGVLFVTVFYGNGRTKFRPRDRRDERATYDDRA
jgi:hypothetical protein